jgi:hypothetical protein
MITRFHIDNFKSLVDFDLPPLPHPLGAFTCLVGLNGAGKSTVLQAFDFLGELARGDIAAWLRERDWNKADLTSRFLKKQLISFRLELQAGALGTVQWEGAYNVPLQRCTAEAVRAGGVDVLKIGEHTLHVAGPEPKALLQYPLQGLDYQGSTLSVLKADRLHPAVHLLKEWVGGLRSLDMLSPQAMRRRAKEGADIGAGGERLSAYLHGLAKPAQERLLATLKQFYPQLEGWTTTALRAGWKDLRVSEGYLDANRKPLETGARQINDGLLRILAVLSQVEGGAPTPSGTDSAGSPGDWTRRACVLFDEIENGINPELMPRLVEELLQSDRQVIVTTHSPLVLNFLPDPVARQAVILLFRNPLGHTKAVRLFDLPSAERRLRLLGPGEVFVDLDLHELPAEAGMLQGGAQQ